MDFEELRSRYEEWLDLEDDPGLLRILYGAACANFYRGNPVWVMFIGPAGCHRKGTDILMDDGTTRKVEDVREGDRVMGPDGPKKVLKLVRGVGDMAEIVPVKGSPFVVNMDHIMTLVQTETGKVIDISVRDYLKLAKSRQKDLKLFRSEIDFPSKKISLDPYFLGCLLGDGCITRVVGFSKPDPEMLTMLEEEAFFWNLNLYKSGEGTSATWYLSGTKGKKNPITEELRKLGLHGLDSHEKFVPFSYKYTDRRTRLEVLAGLLDTDGHLHGNCFDFISASERLASDVQYIARSLGFHATLSHEKKSCQNGYVGYYHRVGISGDTHLIPNRLLRKQAGDRSQKKDVLRTGFSVNCLEHMERYYGFTLEGDGRYLMGDFTVTHNCGKTQLLSSLGTSNNVVMVSTMTPNALVSGYNDPEASLIQRLKDKILIIKDLSATTEINADDRNMLFSILRDAYDGHVAKATGRGTIEFEGKFGILAAGTLAVEQGRKMEGLLGERFLYIRPRIRATRILERSLKNAVRKEEMNNKLREAGAEFLDSWRPPSNGRTLPASVVEAAKEAASVLVVCRSGIMRDSYNKEVSFPAEVTELPTRVYEQMVLLLSAMRYLGAGKEELLATVRRVLCDSIPYVRLRVLQSIIGKQETVSAISTSIKLSRSYTDRTVADLEHLGVIGKRNGKLGVDMPFLLNSLEASKWD